MTNVEIARVIRRLTKRVERLRFRNRRRVRLALQNFSNALLTGSNNDKDKAREELVLLLVSLFRNSAAYSLIAQLEIYGEQTKPRTPLNKWVDITILETLDQMTQEYEKKTRENTTTTLTNRITHYDAQGNRVPKHRADRTDIRNQQSYGETLLTVALFQGARSATDAVRIKPPNDPKHKMIVRIQQATHERSGHVANENKKVPIDKVFNFGADGGTAQHLAELPFQHLVHCGHVEIEIP